MLTRYSARGLVLGLGVVLSASFLGSPCLADMYGFYPIPAKPDGSFNSGSQAWDVARQLTVTVSEYSSNQVRFDFSNTGSVGSSITDIYFDDGTLLSIAQVINPPFQADPLIRVAFTQNSVATVSPPNLPGGEGVGFSATALFSADSDDPPVLKGVDNSGNEWVSVVFNLADGLGFSDVIEALNGGTDLRIGLHVQGIGTGSDSDAFINDPNPIVPVPGAVLLGMLGLGAAGLKLRRFA